LSEKIIRCRNALKLSNSLVNYCLNNDINTTFLQRFWNINEKKDDIKILNRFSECIRLRNNELLGPRNISRVTGTSRNTIGSWFYNDHLPRIVRLLQSSLILANLPENWKWIPLNINTGESYKGPWILVPEKIDSYEDILNVIKQLPMLPMTFEAIEQFNIKKEVKEVRPLLFAYLLGAMIGDCGKSSRKQKRQNTRVIKLGLTRRYESNLRFGNFVSLCANSLGLRMSRKKDQLRLNARSKHGLFYWVSQHSMFIEWIFKMCLGLREGQTTTYNQVKMEWLLKTTRDFRIWFLQGLADSDGYVEIGGRKVGIISSPNEKLIQEIIQSLGVNSYLDYFKDTVGVIVKDSDAYLLPIFSPFVSSYRYEKLKKINNSTRLKGHWPLWLKKKVMTFIRNGLKGYQIVERILEEDGILIHGDSVYKTIKQMRQQK